MLAPVYIMTLMAVPIAAALLATGFAVDQNTLYSADAKSIDKSIPSLLLKIPGSSARGELYMAWPNNDTGHWNVFFAKSADGGKTVSKPIMLSTPNKGHIINQNTSVALNGKNVYVTWWTNKTGVLEQVFRASNDGGNTFGPTAKLNSTGTK
ncbi:MAG: hypothetical protein M3P08_14880 [Thermoproteota archaeon]|nr:hypothetical protein [Thermoproteota archaeon]